MGRIRDSPLSVRLCGRDYLEVFLHQPAVCALNSLNGMRTTFSSGLIRSVPCDGGLGFGRRALLAF